MIQALKISGDVSQSCCFESLTPDMTRFLLKQKEKQIEDGNSDGEICLCFFAFLPAPYGPSPSHHPPPHEEKKKTVLSIQKR